MKTKINAILLLITISANTIAQNVFPQSDALWNIQIDGKEYYYGLSGDTIIGDKSYNKLYLLNDTTLNIDSKNVYVGGFRQDERKVWFRPSSDYFYLPYDDDLPSYSKETLLYDFSKNTGDTIWHNSIAGPYYWYMKDSISASIITSIYIDEKERKIYHTEQYLINRDGEFFPIKWDNNDIWMERVGSINYGLWGFLSQMSLSGYPKIHLLCFKEDNEVKYLATDCNSCFSWTSSILKKNSIPLKVVHENNCIRIIGGPSFFPCQLQLFNSTGQLLYEKTLFSDMEQIPIMKGARGVYLYQIQKDEETIKIGKIITE